MRIYYSGDNESTGPSVAEELVREIGIMLTYACHENKQASEKWRIARIEEERTNREQ